MYSVIIGGSIGGMLISTIQFLLKTQTSEMKKNSNFRNEKNFK